MKSDSEGQDRSWSGFFVGVLIAVLLSAGGLAGPSSAAGTVAKDARIGGDQLRTRFVADLSKKVKFRAFTLDNPYRVIIDLPNVKFKLPAGLGRRGRGLVKGFRYGLVAPGQSRIVIDVKSPVIVDKSFVLRAVGKQPARLVVDIIRTDRKTFVANLRKKRTVNAPVAAKGKTQTLPKAVLRMPGTKKKSGSTKPVVIIDPGHGGIDPGAVTKSGIKEKDIVFAFAKMLRKKLAATGRYNAILTRTIDTYMPLRDRVEFGRHKEGDLFISLHADALPGRNGKDVSGATVYTLSERASDEEAKALAAKENRADIIAGVELPGQSSEVTSILIDLAQRETKNHSITFAGMLLKNLKGVATLNKKPHRFAGFAVLKAPDVPSVLFELGYLTNPDDQKRLQSKDWRNRVSNAVVKSVDKFLSRQIAAHRP